MINEKRLEDMLVHLSEVNIDNAPDIQDLIRLAQLGLKYQSFLDQSKQRISKTGQPLFSKSHGLSASRTYQIWASMIARCTYPTASGYKRYGGIGITVCEKWQDFLGFFEDMGHPPDKKHSLDRVDNRKGYEKSNCRWIPLGDQAKNTRRSIIVSVNGQRMCMKDASRKLGVPYSTLMRRYNLGEGTVEQIAEALPALSKESKYDQKS